MQHLSEYLGISKRGHSNFDFVDVLLDDDNELFIDPSLIELSNDKWSRQAVVTMDSFFNEFYKALRTGNAQRSGILDYAGEQNATKLGYGNGENGKGKTAKGLHDCLSDLYVLVKSIKTISRSQDLPVLMPGFAEDCMSDLLTNILHDLLNSFTASQMNKYGKKPDGVEKYAAWDDKNAQWHKVKRPCWLYRNKELLMIPKWIVRKNFLFGTEQYFRRVILERMRIEKDLEDLSKKDIENNLPKNGEHWMYDIVIKYTTKHPDALSEYHGKLPNFYRECRNGDRMSDECLDKEIYG